MATVTSVQISVDSSWQSNPSITLPLDDSRFYQARAVLSDGSTNNNIGWAIVSGSDYITIEEYGSGIAGIFAGSYDGNAIVKCYSTDDPSVYSLMDVTVGAGSGLSLIGLLITDPLTGEQFGNGYKIPIQAGESRTIEMTAFMSDYEFATLPVRWEFPSGESLYSIESYSDTSVTIRAGSSNGASTSYIYAYCTYGGTEYSAYFGIQVEGAAEAPTVTGVEVWMGGNWYAFSFNWTIQANSTIELRGRAVMSDGSYDYNITWGFEDYGGGFTYTTNGYIGYFTAGNINGTELCWVWIKSSLNPSIYQTVSLNVEGAVEAIPGAYSAHIYNSSTSTWEEYTPYIYNSSTATWEEYEPDIHPFSEE